MPLVGIHDLYAEIRKEILAELGTMVDGLKRDVRPVFKQAINDLAFYSARLLVAAPSDRDRIKVNIGHIKGIMASEEAAVRIEAYRKARLVAARVLRMAAKSAVGFLGSV